MWYTLINFFPVGLGYYIVPFICVALLFGGFLLIREFMPSEEKIPLDKAFALLVILTFVYAGGVGHAFKGRDDLKKSPEGVRLTHYKTVCENQGGVIQTAGGKTICVQITTLSTFEDE